MYFQLTDKEYYYIYSISPRFCVDLLFKNKKKQTLLALRKQEPQIGKYHIPGGRVMFGEFIFHACQRIALEETGLSVISIKLLDYMEFNTEKQRGVDIHTISMLFNCDYEGDRLKKGCRWFYKKDVLKNSDNIHTIHYPKILQYSGLKAFNLSWQLLTKTDS